MKTSDKISIVIVKMPWRASSTGGIDRIQVHRIGLYPCRAAATCVERQTDLYDGFFWPRHLAHFYIALADDSLWRLSQLFLHNTYEH